MDVLLRVLGPLLVVLAVSLISFVACFRSKPPRAHHCSVCKRCVLKMDHHCPWINNCVGFNNYRYFCLFMLYLALGCLYVVVMGYHLFLRSVVPLRPGIRVSACKEQCMTLSWLISLCIFLALCLLGGFHLYLVLTNQTTIEFHVNLTNRHLARRKGESYRNPYDLGWSRNFQQVFGPNKFFHFLWMMPYLAKRPMAWLEFAVSLARDTWQNARWFGPWLEAKRGWLLFPIHVEHLRDQPPWSLSFWPNKVRT
ncbi:unnamed protein product [Effrenium voratum]|nr:unnamed protein product [Effrenium voratum]